MSDGVLLNTCILTNIHPFIHSYIHTFIGSIIIIIFIIVAWLLLVKHVVDLVIQRDVSCRHLFVVQYVLLGIGLQENSHRILVVVLRCFE